MEDLVLFFKDEDKITRDIVEGLYKDGFRRTTDLVERKEEILLNPGRNKKKFLAFYMELVKKVLKIHPELGGEINPSDQRTEDDKILNLKFNLPNDLEIYNEIKVADIKDAGLINRKIINPLNTKTLAEIYFMTQEAAASLPYMGGSKLLYFLQLQEELKNDSEKFIAYYKDHVAETVLAYNFNEEMLLVDAIELALTDLVTLLRKRKEERDAKIVEMYFGLNGCPIFELKAIGDAVELSTNRISQILFETGARGLEIRNLFSGSTLNLIWVNPLLTSRLNAVKDQSLYDVKYQILMCGEIEVDMTQLKRLTEVLDGELVDLDNQIYFVNTNGVGNFKGHYTALVQTLNKEVFPLNFKEISLKTKSYLKSYISYNANITSSLLSCCPHYEKTVDSVDEVKYHIKWQFLAVATKAKRIIFESFPIPMDRKSILAEFNKREVENNLELTTDDQLTMNTDAHFKAQANGVWLYSSENDEVERKSLLSIVEDYIKSRNGKVRFDEVVAYLNENSHVYPPSSIRATIIKLCLIAKSDRELFVHEAYTKQYPEIELSARRQKDVRYNFSKLTVAILKEIPTRRSNFKDFRTEVLKRLSAEGVEIKHLPNFEAYVSYLSNLGILHDSIESGERFIYLNETELNKHDLTSLGKQAEPDYKKDIRSLAINYLKEKENFECPLSELSTEFIQFVKEGVKQNIFYKIFDDKYYFEKSGEGKNRIIRLETAHLPIAKTYLEEVVNPEIITEIISEQPVVEVKQVVLNTELYRPIPFDWSALKPQMKKELADYGFKDDMLEIGINSFYKGLGGDSIDRWGQSILKCLSDFWFRPNDYFDRESYILKLAHGFETYLKIFFPTAHTTDGLASVVEFLPPVQRLKAYKFECKNMNWHEIDKQKQNFSYILGTVSFIGNKFRHDGKNESLDMANIKQAKTITDFAALYIYIGYLLSK